MEKDEVSSSTTIDVWKKVWQTNVLPRVKIFTWHASQNALPNRKGISSRIQNVDDCHSICHSELETVLYALEDFTLLRSI